MTLSVTFLKRDFTTAQPLPSRVTVKVQRYSSKAMGGCDQAEIHVRGDDLQLWEFLEFLRCPIDIVSDEGDIVWWGYVHEVEVTARNPYSRAPSKTRFGAGLDSMVNRVAVAWEDIAVGTYAGPRETTDWANNGLSQSEYGVKEGLFSGESASDLTLAEQARDILLEQKKFPIPFIELNVDQEPMAIIRCRGWWDTLGWRYCNIPVLQAIAYDMYLGLYSYRYNFGTVAIEQIAQGILVSGGDINMASVEFALEKVGAPTDTISVGLYTNPDDKTPTTLIATSSSVNGTSLTTALVWYTFTFSPEPVLTAGTKYFLVLERSGAMDDVNHYHAESDSAMGYTAGKFSKYNGTSWSNQNYDLMFRVNDNAVIPTSLQAQNIITVHGQFMQYIESWVQSGVSSESFRDGDGTALYEVEQLLAHGTTNLRRMLTTVRHDRSCFIYEEPAYTAATAYQIFSDGSLKDSFGNPVRKSEARAGFWARLADIIPPSLDTTRLGDAVVRFIEMTEYDAANDKTYYVARDELDPLTVGRPIDG